MLISTVIFQVLNLSYSHKYMLLSLTATFRNKNVDDVGRNEPSGVKKLAMGYFN